MKTVILMLLPAVCALSCRCLAAEGTPTRPNIVLSTISPRMSAAGNTDRDLPRLGEILATLRPDHPRVMARATSFEHIRSLVSQGGLPAKLYTEVNGKTFTVQLQEPTGAAFEVMDCKPLPSSPNPEPQTRNAGRRKLAVHLRGVENTRVQVTMAPSPQTEPQR